MFSPIFKENVQGQKHAEGCEFADPELPSYKKHKYVVKNEEWP